MHAGIAGLPVAFAALVYIVVASPKLLPDRKGIAEVAREARREYTFSVVVDKLFAGAGRWGAGLRAGGRLLVCKRSPSVPDGARSCSCRHSASRSPHPSPSAARSLEKAGLRHLPGVFVVDIQRADGGVVAAPAPDTVVLIGDIITFAGDVQFVKNVLELGGLQAVGEHTSRVLCSLLLALACMQRQGAARLAASRSCTLAAGTSPDAALPLCRHCGPGAAGHQWQR